MSAPGAGSLARVPPPATTAIPPPRPFASLGASAVRRRDGAVRSAHARTHARGLPLRTGEQYRQWNAAFDAGYAAAQGTPYVTLHDAELDHALKEVDASAFAVCRTPEQVVGVLRYAVQGKLG